MPATPKGQAEFRIAVADLLETLADLAVPDHQPAVAFWGELGLACLRSSEVGARLFFRCKRRTFVEALRQSRRTFV